MGGVTGLCLVLLGQAQGQTLAVAQDSAEVAVDAVLSRPLTFARVVRLLDQTHPLLASYRLKARAAQLNAGAAARLPEPVVGLSINEAPVMLSDLPLMVEATQAIPLHGRLAREAQMVGLEGEMAQAELAMVRRALIRDARKAFARYRLAQASQEAMAPLVSLLKSLISVAERRYETGQASRLDSLRAQEQLARMQNDLLDMQRELGMARANLAMVLQLPVGAPLPTVDLTVPLPNIPPEPVLFERLLTDQPELQALQVQRLEATLEQAQLETSRFPELMLRGAYMFSPKSMDMWSLGAMISIPLQSRRTWQPRREAARLAQDSLDQQEQAKKAELRGELTMRVLALQSAQAHVTLHDEQLIPLTRQMLAVARANYEAGSGSLKEVLETTAMLHMHHLEREKYLKDWLDALAELEMRVGPLEEETHP